MWQVPIINCANRAGCNFILIHTGEVKSVQLIFFIANLTRCHYAIQKALETCKYNSQDANDLSNEENEV